MLSDYQLKIAEDYNISIGNVKKLVPNFCKNKHVLHYKKLATLCKTRIKNKKILEFSQSKWLKPYIEFNTQKRIETEKNGDKDGKSFYKLMNNAIYGKTMENLRNNIDVRLVNNKKEVA